METIDLMIPLTNSKKISPFKHLEFSAKESFDALVTRCAALERFRDIIFENGKAQISFFQ